MIDVFEPIRSEMNPSKPPRNDDEHVVDLLYRNETFNLHQPRATIPGPERDRFHSGKTVGTKLKGVLN
jgi:hypothetical protein